MKRYRWEIQFGLFLLALSVAINLVQYLVFRDTQDILVWTMSSLAFLPISVLFVTLVMDRLLVRREKRTRLEKLNMVISAFFSEVGTELLTYFSGYDPALDKFRQDLIVTGSWTERQFSMVSQRLRGFDFGVDIKKTDLMALKTVLLGKRNFLLRLLENPSLLEHESFTQFLQAVFHLIDELAVRKDLGHLPDADYAHLAIDIKRAYSLLVGEWLAYMGYLKNNYPYLFSLAMRTNPFDPNASPEVK